MERLNTAATRALNALPPGESDAFDAMAAEDEYLSEHVASFRRVAAELAEGFPETKPCLAIAECSP